MKRRECLTTLAGAVVAPVVAAAASGASANCKPRLASEDCGIRLHPAQQAYCDCQSPVCGYTGPRGAGKAFVGAYDLLMRIQDGKRYAIISPKLRDCAYRTVLEVCRLLGRECQSHPNHPEGWLLFVQTAAGGQARVDMRQVAVPKPFEPCIDFLRHNFSDMTGVWVDHADQAIDLPTAPQEVCTDFGDGPMPATPSWMVQDGTAFTRYTFSPVKKPHWLHRKLVCRPEMTTVFSAQLGENPHLPPAFRDLFTAKRK